MDVPFIDVTAPDSPVERGEGVSPPMPGVDWRLFLPAQHEQSRLLFIGDRQRLSRSFGDLDIAIDVWSWDEVDAAARADLRNGERRKRFDAVAAPMGFDVKAGRSQDGRLDSLRNVHGLIRPGGSLLLGFSNQWGLRRTLRRAATPSSRRKMSDMLRQVGYTAVAFLGAMPDTIAPEYVFPLRAHTLQFVLCHRYRQKLPHFVPMGVAAHLLLEFLPFYYAVASVA